MANQINPQSVIPWYWKSINVTSDDELVFYGKLFIRMLIQHWRYEERRCVDRIKDLQSKIDLLKGQTVNTLLLEASKYENPEFPQVEVPCKNWNNNPEPMDANSLVRKPGTTTLNVCGWCRFAQGGPRRYSYSVTASCGLLPHEPADGGKYGSSEQFHFNTPCALTHGTNDLIETSVNHLEMLLKEAKHQKSATAKKVKYLLRLESLAINKPLTPGQRPSDGFNLGDEVMCFIDFEDVERKGFLLAKVVPGYRHHDGCVTVIAEEKVHSNLSSHGGRGLCYGFSDPRILLKWEYEYLKAHPDFLKVWLRAANSEVATGLNPEAFSAAI